MLKVVVKHIMLKEVSALCAQMASIWCTHSICVCGTAEHNHWSYAPQNILHIPGPVSTVKYSRYWTRCDSQKKGLQCFAGSMHILSI